MKRLRCVGRWPVEDSPVGRLVAHMKDDRDARDFLRRWRVRPKVEGDAVRLCVALPLAYGLCIEGVHRRDASGRGAFEIWQGEANWSRLLHAFYFAVLAGGFAWLLLPGLLRGFVDWFGLAIFAWLLLCTLAAKYGMRHWMEVSGTAPKLRAIVLRAAEASCGAPEAAAPTP
jgi:hypothetical protein